MLALLLALQVAAAPRQDSMPTDSALRARVTTAILRFQREWRDAWQETRDQVQAGAYDNPFESDLRIIAAHCHFLGTHARVRSHLIRGTVPSHATCPIWLSDDAPVIRDERHGIDGALTITRRWRVRDLRRSLRLQLDAAEARLPGDAEIAAQRVRFAIDDDDAAGAVAAAAACTSSEGYCGMLRALVLHRAGRIAAADSAFADALAVMPAAERCAWNDISVLLPPELRDAYHRTSCEDRAEFEAQFWWLSDPLWLEDGNERRAEQFARKVRITQLAPLGEDERQRWQPQKGGEAVAETILRYGWPTQFYWPGVRTDEGHDNWLLRAAMVDTAPPYVVREYSRDRLHTVPRAKALLSPESAVVEDWTLSGESTLWDWWPQEHFGRDAGMIVQMGSGQQVMLRRSETTLFALAVDLDSAAQARAPRETMRATLFEARSPDSTSSRGSFAVRGGRTAIVHAPFAPGRVLLGVETPGDHQRRAARTRYSVEMLPALRTLGDARSLSQPMLIEPSGDAMGAMPAEAAISRMLGSTTVPRARRLGIYWEAYGFAASDTVEIVLALSREGKPGMFERVVSGFGLWGEEGGRADVRWTELPGSGRTLTQREANVLVQMRSVSLDLRRQRAGRYRLEVTMKTPGGTAVTSERLLSLR